MTDNTNPSHFSTSSLQPPEFILVCNCNIFNQVLFYINVLCLIQNYADY